RAGGPVRVARLAADGEGAGEQLTARVLAFELGVGQVAAGPVGAEPDLQPSRRGAQRVHVAEVAAVLAGDDQVGERLVVGDEVVHRPPGGPVHQVEGQGELLSRYRLRGRRAEPALGVRAAAGEESVRGRGGAV